MKLSGKIILLATGSAILGSVATTVAMKQVLFSDNSETISSYNGGNAVNGLFQVSQSPVQSTDFTAAAENTINGVVSIKSYATPRGYSQGGNGGFFNDPFFEYFFGSPNSGQRRQQQQQQPKQQQMGLGSGVIISSDGYIVTNNHVIDDAERLEVTLNDNRTFDATVIGSDSMTDLALIKIDALPTPSRIIMM